MASHKGAAYHDSKNGSFKEPALDQNQMEVSGNAL